MMVSKEGEKKSEMEAVHRKRLGTILRYIADMHHSAENSFPLFVRGDPPTSDYFENEGAILFSTKDFARIVSSIPAQSSPPFSFYAASEAKNKSSFPFKRTISGSTKVSGNSPDNRPCWLRVTRPVADQPPNRKVASIRDYLRNWQDRTCRSLQELLSSVEAIQNAPKIDPTTVPSAQQEIKTFLRLHRKYLQKRVLRNALEPLYNSLFEWLQESHEEELVWGFGNVSVRTEDGSYVDGPLFEVLVEVELARDGALIVRPRPHTGVTLNREVTTAIGPPDILSRLHKTTSEMETQELSPGQPQTFGPLLKKMALELSSAGVFVSHGQARPKSRDPYKLVVTDAWCVYPRPKPSAVWARDASVMAEKVLVQDSIPLPSWSLTHGPAILSEIVAKSKEKKSSKPGSWSSWFSMTRQNDAKLLEEPVKPLLPLPTSSTQNQIAELLLTHGAPALVVEGPPGTGKTHTIANIVCAYLARGKRVLVTSKGAPALSVLRERMPKSIQDLCVDVSMSESSGMRQLQQTVERLADRVSCINAGIQEDQCSLLKRSITDLERQLAEMDKEVTRQSESKRRIMQSVEGRQMTELAIYLLEKAPWLMRSVARMTPSEVDNILQQAKKVYIGDSSPAKRISGYSTPISSRLITGVAAKAGASLSALSIKATRAIASVPLVGMLTGADNAQKELEGALSLIRLDGEEPKSAVEWKVIMLAMQQEMALLTFETGVLLPHITRDQWPHSNVFRSERGTHNLKQSFIELLEKAAKMKTLALKLKLSDALSDDNFDIERSRIASQLQKLSKDLTEATVVTELSRMFSADAQSALIRFAQVAGKAKFSKSSQSSKLTQRQRRHRQEYLEAFEKCVRFIPCWVMTSSQISDYLPPELGLFDLVIVDEASQSDVTILPGMLRGKQWLVVGDGKQVSPTESFVSEVQIESLRAALPHSPLKDSLLPGQSFFDLCAQGFPQGRAVLCEHFRCAPEIISFSNDLFYDGKLTPLRLPTSQERLTPCVVDVKVRTGAKEGKTNVKECDTVVKLVKGFINSCSSATFPRSIGVISLVGEEQSRLIRGRLLDAIGPQKYKEHNILVGEPPNFQGAERDVIFLTMVCSPGSVPTQSQLYHAQRANVALSRARDRVVLVRSIDVSHVPNRDDIKIPIIDFFLRNNSRDDEDEVEQDKDESSIGFAKQVRSILSDLLSERGYTVRSMGIVWRDGLAVENGERAAITIEGIGESTEIWTRIVNQQRVIERVGWKTLRVDAASILLDHEKTLRSIQLFLSNCGVRRPGDEQEEKDRSDEFVLGNQNEAEEDRLEQGVRAVNENMADDEEHEMQAGDDQDDLIVISSDDEYGKWDGGRQRADDNVDDMEDPRNFGDVVDLTFLEKADQQDDDDSDDFLESQPRTIHRQRRSGRKSNGRAPILAHRSDGDTNITTDSKGKGQDGDEIDEDFSRPQKRHRSRLDQYSRDGRFYPGRGIFQEDEDHLYDTDSDLVGQYDEAEDVDADYRPNEEDEDST